MPRRLARRGLTTSTRLFWPTRVPRALTIVWVAPVPGMVRTTSELPAAIWATMCSCSASASSSSTSVEGSRRSGSIASTAWYPSSSAHFAVALPARASSTGCSRCTASATSAGATSSKVETSETRLHRDLAEVAGEAAQLVDDGVRLEGAVVVGEGDEARGVERDAVLLLENAGERRVEHGGAAQRAARSRGRGGGWRAGAAAAARSSRRGRGVQRTTPMPRCTASRPRVVDSSRLFAVIRSAAVRAERSARSSRMSCDSSVLLPVMKRASPPGCVVESSMRVAGASTKCSSGDGPPNSPNSSRQASRAGSATSRAVGAGMSSGAVAGCEDAFGVTGISPVSSSRRLAGHTRPR